MNHLQLDIQLTLDAFTLHLNTAIPLAGVTGILGPSGSGKTSLLRSIAGLEARAEGKIFLADTPWLDSRAGVRLPTEQRGVGYVFQDARLLPHLSVRENLDFAVRRANPDGPAIDWDEVVVMLALDGLLHRTPAALSGGERQRVAIARALLNRPRILLMDEPLAATDNERRAELLPYFRTVIERSNLPMVYVSHSLDELATLSDRLLVLRSGRQVAFGPTEDVMRRLDLGEVSGAEDAGSVIEAAVLEHQYDLHLTQLQFHGQTLSIPLITSAPDTPVKLRIHSRDVALATEEPRGLSIRNTLQGDIVEIAEQASGPSADVLVAVGDHVLRARITRASLRELNLAVGDTVYALIKTASVETR